MAKYTRHFFVGSTCLGQSFVNDVIVQAHFQPPCSYLFFCPVCGEAWAKSPVVHNSTEAVAGFQSIARTCRNHRISAYDFPGSLYISWDLDFNASLPDPALFRELQILLALYPATNESVLCI